MLLFFKYFKCLPARLHMLSRYLLFFLFLLAPFSSHGADQSTNKENSDSSVYADQYKVAKNYYYKLEREPELGGDRKKWLNGVRNFRKIYLLDPKSEIAPSCLFMMGKLHQRMKERFQQVIDGEEAINYYKDVARLFPKSNLADDALLKTAEMYLYTEKNHKKAATTLEKIINLYPEGDKHTEAVNRLNDLLQKHEDITTGKNSANKAVPRNLVNVLPVKYWSSDEYTRIVIRASQPVGYTPHLLEKNSDLPRRLYIDFDQSYIPPKFRSPIPIQDGLLKQVRTGQFNPTTVRVVLDIETISDYKVFNLNDPFRVVVDVHGQNKNSAHKTVKKQVAAQPKKRPISKTGKVQKALQPAPEKTVASTATPPKPTQAELKPVEKKDIIVNLKDIKKIKPEAQLNTDQQDNMNLSLAQQLGLGVKKIVIDPGHGGKDPGAMAFGLKEKNIVLSVAQNAAETLRNQYGYEVVLTRTRDTYLPLEERTAIANTEKADLFVSIHVNAHPSKSVKGIETFYLNLATNAEAMRVAALENATSTHNISDLQDILSDLMQNSKIEESSRLAEYVHGSIVSGLEGTYKVKNLGVKQAPFYVLIGAQMPAVLAEISFITNPRESELLRKPEYLNKVGEQIADGIRGYVEHHTTAAIKR